MVVARQRESGAVVVWDQRHLIEAETLHQLGDQAAEPAQGQVGVPAHRPPVRAERKGGHDAPAVPRAPGNAAASGAPSRGHCAPQLPPAAQDALMDQHAGAAGLAVLNTGVGVLIHQGILRGGRQLWRAMAARRRT